MMTVEVVRVPMGGPGDVSGLRALFAAGAIRPDQVVAIMAKTEGNGCVNDFSRGYGTLAFQVLLAEALGVPREEVARRVVFVMSGGTEGVLSPHATVFARRPGAGGGTGPKRLAVGIAHTRDLLPEEIGRLAQARQVAQAVREALRDAEVASPANVHFVQVKCPLLTSDRVQDALRRGRTVATLEAYQSMGYSRGASALGVALALGEIPDGAVSDGAVCRDWDLSSGVASTSAGVELLNCEILVMGNSAASASDLVVGHAVMRDAIDGEAVRAALRGAGLRADGALDPAQRDRIVNVFAKAEADPRGIIRDRRHTMLNDSDIHHSRHARAAAGAVIASIVGDPMIYVSGGAEHQGPPGGGPVAVIARA